MKIHTHEDDSGEFECPIGPRCCYQRPLRVGRWVCWSADDGRTITGTLRRRSRRTPGSWLIRLATGRTGLKPPSSFMR
jgi:hypothetical protein